MINPTYPATRIQDMAERAKDKKLAFVLTGLSIALVGVMVMREFRELFRSDPHTRYQDRGESSRHQRG